MYVLYAIYYIKESLFNCIYICVFLVGMFMGHNCDVSKPEPTVSIPTIFEFRIF